MATKNKVHLSEFKYNIIHKWMTANNFVEDLNDKYRFIKKNDNLEIHIVADNEGDNSFMILFPENGKTMSSFTGDLNLPTLLGYLLWNHLITDYKITS
jgi:hypothetical protein